MLRVHPVGTKVLLGNSEEHFEGRIVSISIKISSYITYEVVWWSGKTRESKYLHESEFQLVELDHALLDIGFHAILRSKGDKAEEVK